MTAIDASSAPVVPDAIPAATVIVVRDRAEGREPELLLVERSAGMAFAAGAIVFPGGRIDPADEVLGATLAIADGAATVAAIRETLEETAVPIGLRPLPSPALARDLQRELLAGIPFAELLDRHGLRIEAAALTPFARWLPTLHIARRFDTHFLLAAAPPGDWQPIVGEGESRIAEWRSAAEVLRREAAGEARLIFPTRCNLARLAQHASFDAMVEDAKVFPVETISPWIERRDGVDLLTIPDHLGYPVTQFPLKPGLRG